MTKRIISSILIVLLLLSSVAAASTDGSSDDPIADEQLAVITLTLSPSTATNEIGETHTLTAELKSGQKPIVGKTVNFVIDAGPNAGLTGSGTTDIQGQATWSYTSSLTGTDKIYAYYATSVFYRSNDVLKVWTSANNPPVAYVNGPYTGDEGSAIDFDASASYDPDGDPLTYYWDFNNDGTFDFSSTSPFATYTWPDDYTGTVKLKVMDNGGLSDTASTTVTVYNVAPVVGEIYSPVDPVQVGATVEVSSSFTDAGVLDTHTAVWDWGDGTSSAGTVIESDGSGTVSGEHSYSSAGIYEIELTVTDKDGGTDSAVSNYVVIYDPEGGFVTGGGWINSPAGAYVPDTTLTGTANFGFVSKYKKGATVPTGVTQFQFQVADLNFHSDEYDWLVIAGARAQYKGTGTINGEGEYGFMLTAIDGDLNGGSSDKFRIKIWDKDTDAIVYDNMLGVEDTAEPTTELQGGSIKIHKE